VPKCGAGIVDGNAVGKTLTATLSAGAGAGVGLALLNSTGQSLLVVPGAVGRSPQVRGSNLGSAAALLVFKVSRTIGTIGACKLTLSS
jgi:hypothetical protein